MQKNWFAIFTIIFLLFITAALGGPIEITRIRSVIDMALPEGNPQGMTYHPDRETLFIVANNPGRLIEMTLAGDIVATYSSTAYSTNPQGIAYDPFTGNLLVCKGNELIYEVAPDGTLLNGGPLFETSGQMNADGIAVDPFTGNVYLGDDTFERVVEVDRTGEFIRAIQLSDLGITEPQGLTMLGELLIVADDRESTRSLHVFTRSGQYLELLIQTEPVGVEDPEAVAAILDDGLCIAGQMDNRIVCYDLGDQGFVNSEFSWPLEALQIPTGSTASGMCYGRLEPLGDAFDFVCKHDIMDVTKAEIRMGALGDKGPVVFAMGETTTTASRIDRFTLDEDACWEDFIDSLRSGNLYTLISSAAEPKGEIRGQIPAPPSEVFFPQFGTGSGFFSDVVIVGTSNTTSDGSVFFYDRSGDLTEVPLLDDGETISTSMVEFSLNQAATQTSSSDPDSDDLLLGSVKAVSFGDINGIIRFNLPGIGIAGVGASPPMKRAILPARNMGGIRTGVAVRNNSLNSMILRFRLLNANNSAVLGGVTTVTIPSEGSLALFVDELFPDLDLSGFDGSLVLEVDHGSFSAVALELGNSRGQFTTLPVESIQ